MIEQIDTSVPWNTSQQLKQLPMHAKTWINVQGIVLSEEKKDTVLCCSIYITFLR